MECPLNTGQKSGIIGLQSFTVFLLGINCIAMNLTKLKLW